MNGTYLAGGGNECGGAKAPMSCGGVTATENGRARRPAEPGETIVLYGTGFGPTSPAVSAYHRFAGVAAMGAESSPRGRYIGGR